VAVNDLKLSPSEVRQMTVGEINAVIWAMTRTNEPDGLEELYTELMELRGDG